MARGGIRINVSAETRGLSKGLNQAQGSLDKFAKGAGRLAGLSGGGLAGVVGGLTSLGGAAEFLRESVSATEGLYRSTKRLSTVTGMDLRTSNAWVNLAKSRGIETNTLVRSYTSLAKQVGAAQAGGKRAVETFNQLGVSQAALRSGNTAEIVGRIADGFARHADGLGKARVASQLFGRAYAPMLQLLNKGGVTLRELLAHELKHGAVLSLSEKQYQRAVQSQRDFNMSMEKLKVAVGNGVLPVVTRFTEKISGWLQKGANQHKIDQFVKSVTSMGRQFGGVLSNVAPLVRQIAGFVGHNPALAQMVGYAIAFKFAIKTISFLNPLRGVASLIFQTKALGTAGKLAGTHLVSGISTALNSLKRKMATFLVALELRFGTAGTLAGRAFGVGMAAAMVAAALIAADQITNLLGSLMRQLGGKDSATSLRELIGGTDAGGPVENQVDQWLKSHPHGDLKDFFRATRRSRGADPRTGLPMKIPTAASMFGASPAALPAMPDFTESQNTSPRSSSAARKAMAPRDALVGALKLRGWATPFEARLARISIHDQSLSANRRRRSILDGALGKWKSVRGDLRKYAIAAQDGGDLDIAGQISEMIVRGDEKAARWKVKLAAVNDAVSVASSQNAIDNQNRKLQIAQDTIKSEESFLRAAFGFGDIGSGGRNAWLAAGGAGMVSSAGGNVNITIQSLHPGDAKTKKAIGSAVTTALGNQGAVRRAKTVVGA